MSKLLTILQIKCRRKPDFWMWLQWYTLYLKCDQICIIDDASPVSITQTVQEFYSTYRPTTIIRVVPAMLCEHMTSVNTTRQIRNANIGMMLLKPNEGDWIITPDDDEFWWFDSNIGLSFADVSNRIAGKTYAVPWILMSSNVPLKNRPAGTSYADCFHYAAPNDSNEVKFAMKYQSQIITQMHWGTDDSVAIMPGERENNFFTTTWHHKHTAPIKCFHYRCTTEQEYNNKIKRNINDKSHIRSYAIGKTFYNFDRLMYKNWPGYIVKDSTVNNIIGSLYENH